MAKPNVMILFCEDVRNETGNRVSLMGLLGPHLDIETETVVLKGLVAGAIVRFNDGQSHQGSLRMEFFAGDEGQTLPPSPPRSQFPIEPPEGESDWQVQIFGSFAGLEVHQGMVIRCTIGIDDEEYVGELHIRQPTR